MKNKINGSVLSLVTILLLSLSGCNSSDSTDNTTPTTGDENGSYAVLDNDSHTVSYSVIAGQRVILADSLNGSEGAQAPRDIDSKTGANSKVTTTAPAYTEMNLCDIHFHISAEHKGGEFTTNAGNGDGHGYGSGYKYSGTLTDAETAPYAHDGSELFTNSHNPLESGDTFEVHYVYTSNIGQTLGHTLGTCLEGGADALLRVETQVYVAVNDRTALDFNTLNTVTGNGTVGNLYQASNIPNNTGTPIYYEGSTTGAGYNEEVSPYQVSWSVRPKIAKVDIATVGKWALNANNEFEEDHAHDIRNLVVNPDLLSVIK